MITQLSRMELVFGPEPLARLRASRVAVFGVGGVGGNVVEALARSGVGTLDIFDSDRVTLTNLNRQLMATHSTIGEYKVDAAAARVHDIDPKITVQKHRTFYLPDDPNSEQPDFPLFDYVIDAIDTVTGKIGIILAAKKAGVPVISCMGCGNRVDPAKLTVCDIYETQGDALARTMRKELRKRGVDGLKVVYSTEPAIRPYELPESDREAPEPGSSRRSLPGSTAFVPPAAGILAASVVVRDLTNFDPGDRVRGGRP